MKDERCNEQLSALLDGELTPEEHEQLLEKLRGSAALRQQLAELRKVRTLYRMAFEPAVGKSPPAARRSAYAAAALLLVCLGFVLGLALPGALSGDGTQTTFRLEAMQAQAPLRNTVVHVSKGDDKALASALRRLEALLQERESKGDKFSVELVVNGDALRLVRTDVSPYREELQSLLARYDNLTLVACQQTLKRLQAQGEGVPLLPGVATSDSALDRIVGRVREGWTYIKI